MTYQMLPSLTEGEYQALKADIAARGVMVPIERDEMGNTLDGFHREQICHELNITDYPVTIRAGMSEDEKIHHAIALNLERRHLNSEQRRELVVNLRSNFGWSNVKIAETIGVSHQTVMRDIGSGCPFGQPENERVEGKDGKSYPARKPKTITASTLQQAEAALKCLPLTGIFDGFEGITTAVEVIQDANKTLYSASANRLEPMLSSDSYEWYAPAKILKRVRLLLGTIDLDPCTSEAANSIVRAAEIFTLKEDGLNQSWQGRVYMNPPYGDTIGQWAAKLKRDYESGEVVAAVALVPARTDTQWFRALAEYPRCFLYGRLKFTGPNNTDNTAPFPSAIIALGCDVNDLHKAFQDLGDIYTHFAPEK